MHPDLSHWVYILLCADGRSYVGCTKDMEARLRRHEAGTVHSTKDRLPVKCMATFGFIDKHKAYAFEKYLKSGSGRAFMNRHFF
ncbi:MAG: GIY-YIG nuclease family protein [Flavobacteriales bacterium]|nr:GIY-YIG nuclease family protein [Flavobacteriales bacterium]